MATDIKGPGVDLAQSAGDAAPSNSWVAITKWASSPGFKGVQIPSWDGRLFELTRAAESRTYCDEITGIARENGVQTTELGTHLQGQLVAVHPAYDDVGFDAFAPASLKGKPERQRWVVDQMLAAFDELARRWRPIRDHIIRLTEKAFDDFADAAQLKRMLGL